VFRNGGIKVGTDEAATLVIFRNGGLLLDTAVETASAVVELETLTFELVVTVIREMVLVRVAVVKEVSVIVPREEVAFVATEGLQSVNSFAYFV
jgi:hypothetical protein